MLLTHRLDDHKRLVSEEDLMKYDKQIKVNGAPWLDKYYPGWWQVGRVNLSTLNQLEYHR